MADLFLKIVNMSISASWLILAVLLLRFILKKSPKWVNVLLWGIVGLRLIMPFSIESSFSLIPSMETIDTVAYSSRPYITSGISAIDDPVNQYLGSRYFEGVTVPANNFFNITSVGGVIWLLGMLALLIYTWASYRKLQRKVATAIPLRDNIYQSENVTSPFVLGILHPRIYLPFRIAEKDMTHVIAHEQAHIKRRDYWIKPLGFLLLSLYWFNPLMWLAYALLCRDIELACDEKIIKDLGTEQRAAYSQALLTCSAGHGRIAACPLAFGEAGVKERVKNVLNYKKPAFWIVIVALLSCAAVSVCFLTNPTISVDERLATFIDCEIASRHQSDKSGDHYCCLDWKVLGKEKHGNKTTIYMWVLYEEFSHDENGLTLESGAHTPTVITVREKENSYHLAEYWTPRDGSYYAPDIKERFPIYLWHKASDSQRYIDEQSATLEEMAKKHFGITASGDKSGAVNPAGIEISLDIDEEVQRNRPPDAVIAYAQDYIRQQIAAYREGWPQIGDPSNPCTITDAKITGLTPVNTGTSSLTSGLNLYLLEYRLRVEGNVDSILVGGMNTEMIEGENWLTEWSSTGQPYLLLHWEDSGEETRWQPVGTLSSEDFLEFNTPAMLEKYGNKYTAAAMELYAQYQKPHP